MAISALKITHRSHIPGTAGFDTSGNPKQGKMRVIGEYTEASYATGGSVVLRNKLGVSTVDIINFWVKGTLAGAGAASIIAQYDDTNQKVFCLSVAATTAQVANATNLGVVKFEVIGDAAYPTENTITDSINSVAGTPLA